MPGAVGTTMGVVVTMAGDMVTRDLVSVGRAERLVTWEAGTLPVYWSLYGTVYVMMAERQRTHNVRHHVSPRCRDQLVRHRGWSGHS